MRLEEDVYIKTYKCSVPAGTPVKFVKVTDKPIGRLIKALGKEEIHISPEASHQRVTIESNKTIDIPFTKSTGDAFDINGYILRTDDKSLEIFLRNYDKREERKDGRIGGDIDVEGGIRGVIKFTGDYEKGKIVQRVAEVVREFYKSR